MNKPEEQSGLALNLRSIIKVLNTNYVNFLSLIVFFIAEKTARIINSVVYRRWPNNVVPYTLDSAFTTSDRAIIAAVSYLFKLNFYFLQNNSRVS